MNRLTVAALALVVVASGCTALSSTDAGQKSTDLAKSSGVDTSGVTPGTSFWMEQKATEKNQQDLVQKEPIPNMDNSLERENLRRRYKTLNDRDKVFHVYLINYGNVMAYYTAKGKVSSANSKLTQPEQVWRIPGCESWKEGNNCWVTTSSPQLDGSYGTNGDGKFFYTSDGAYVESNLKYIVSERPLNIQDGVQLTKKVN